MASSLLSMAAHEEQREHSCSPSAAGPPSPSSNSSDSPPSSDPDTSTHISTISPWFSTTSGPGLKGLGMDVDDFSSRPIMEFDSNLTFENRMHEMHAVDPYSNYNMDELILDQTSTSIKQDVITLEELIREGAYDATTPSSFSSYHPQTLPFQTSISPSTFTQSLPTPSTNGALHSQPSSEAAFSSHPLSPSTAPNGSLSTPDEPKYTQNQPDYFRSQSENGYTLSRDGDLVKSETHANGSMTLDQIPSAIVSSEVVYPSKEACIDLPVVFPSIPLAGTKSRVETQIKLALDLAIPVSASLNFPSGLDPGSSSVSPGGSPSSAASSVISRELYGSDTTQASPTHYRVGTYSYLRLPYGTTTKRRSSGMGGKRDTKSNDLEDTLQMTADVVCCAAPTVTVQSCQSCQAREAKRTARKLAARVRPPPNVRKTRAKGGKCNSKKGKNEDGDNLFDGEEDEDEEEEEPNVDASILQFNCGEVLSFTNGGVTLPMRITCYCRHHKEKIGFQIVFVLRDYQGRIVGRGTTPPILITDDHKSTNAVSKLPPMHPLRQTLHLTSSPRDAPLSVPVIESHHLNTSGTNEEPSRAPTKRREFVEASQKKRRTKPYDGRPNRTPGVNPGIEGRQGVVLALHPAHTRMQEARSQPNSTPVTRSSTPSSETRFILPSQSINGTRNIDNEPSNTNLLFGTEIYPPSPTSIPPDQSILFSQMESQYPQMPPQIATSSTAPIYSSLSFPSEVPRMHRLIPSSGPTTGGIEITILGANFHPSLQLECVFGGAIASSTHRWSDNTLVCVLPPRAAPGVVAVEFKGVEFEGKHDEPACLFTYVDESERQLMELALRVVGLKMTGKIEEARDVAMRIVRTTQSPTMTTGEVSHMNSLSDTPLLHHQLLGSLNGVDLETLTIKLLTLMDVPIDSALPTSPPILPINHKNATGQTLLHLAVFLALPSLASCLVGRSVDVDARNNNGLTALHFAAMAGWKEGVELLINGGASADILDEMGLTAAGRARDAGYASLAEMLDERETTGDNRSGDEGDDERWQSDVEQSEDDASEVSSREYPGSHAHIRVPSVSRVLEESSEAESEVDFESKSNLKTDVSSSSQETEKALRPDKKHDVSFVERLLPQGILPNVQIPGFLQMQLPEKAWGALPSIPVFPILVPLPNLPNWPWNDSSVNSKKGAETSQEKQHDQQQQQPAFAMLWTAYDSIANNAWRAQWEKWTALMTALQTANNNDENAELPPYTPREDPQRESKQPLPDQADVSATQTANRSRSGSETMRQDNKASQSSSRSTLAKVKRRVGYGEVKVPETEVEAYQYQPARRQKVKNKQDHMLVLFWIPILCIGFLYALYTALPYVFQPIKRLLPAPFKQRI